MACVICGDSATIEAHILPRALYRTVAGDQQHAFEGSRFREGVKFQAKGLFDKSILCLRHEEMLGPADDYGVRFLRNFERHGSSLMNAGFWSVPNPRPDLLVRFVAACIWRRGISQVGRDARENFDLGPAEPRLRGLLFGNLTTYDPPLMLKRRRFLSQGHPLHEVMWSPGKAWGLGHNTWSFFALGCEFFMKLNPHSHPAIPSGFQVNRRDPALCLDGEPEEISSVEGMVEIGANMLRTRDPARSERSAEKPGARKRRCASSTSRKLP